MSFDGRSLSHTLPAYSFRERLIILFSMNAMPLLTRLFLSHRINTVVWRLLGCRVGRGSVIRMGTQINAPTRVVIGRNCSIHGHLKSRGGIAIGDSVELVEEVMISTQSHNTDSPHFESVYVPVFIDDYSWLGPRCIVLPGVTLAKGTVVAAGAVVTKDTEEWRVYAGVPARMLKQRAVLEWAAT